MASCFNVIVSFESIGTCKFVQRLCQLLVKEKGRSSRKKGDRTPFEEVQDEKGSF